MKKLIPQSLKNIYHLLQAVLANFLYGFPSKNIKVIGVTGTNGKTTTVQMITKILEEASVKPDGYGARRRVAMASTINFKLAEKEWVNETKFTTLSAFQVQKFILDAVKAECEYLVLETSSHSLDQYRVWGVEYQTAVITNVTREHLDYHRTMEKYRAAKLKLFRKAKTAIVNLDMERPEEYLDCGAENIFGYSLKIPNPKSQKPNKSQSTNHKIQTVIAENIELGADSSRFTVNSSRFDLKLVGEFNIENSLAAICVGLSENISLESMTTALEKIQGVPGRMEYVPNEKGLNIIVDFALTPDALEKLYGVLVKIKKPEAKILAVFGSCGERDRGKRPIMGEIVSKYADDIILTNDESYHEDPEQIIKEIEVGIKNKELNKNYWIVPDRREAIKKALQIARPGDIVAVTGMGAEDTMAVGDERIPWNDKKIILEELEKLSLKTNHERLNEV